MPLPVLTVDDAVPVPEPFDAGSPPGYATFTVTLSNASTVAVTVHYESGNDSAVAPSDYSPVTGTIVFAPGETAKTIQVDILGDNIGEGTENFQIVLSNPVDATILDGIGVGTILDDPGDYPRISIGDAVVAEPPGAGSPPGYATFTVTLSNPSSLPVTVHYESGNDSAVAPSDYAPVTGTIVFTPGQTALTVQVEILGDDFVESPENFQIALSNSVNATIQDDTGVGTILDGNRPGAGFLGSAGGDVLSIASLPGPFNGLGGNDTVAGGSGTDKLLGGTGDDVLDGGGGNDRLDGNQGDDALNGGLGNDMLLGGAGDDVLDGGAGNDVMIGGAGADRYAIAPLSGNDLIAGFDRFDVVDLSLSGAGFGDVADVQAAAADVRGGVLIDLGGGNSLTILGKSVATLDNGDFIF